MTDPAPSDPASAAEQDRPAIPPLSLLFGYGPVLLLPACAALAFLLPRGEAWLAVALGQLWGGALVLFLAGVRRGLSFFTAGGPRPAQIATMLWLFLLGLAALAARVDVALAALIVAFGSVAWLDPRAARRGEVPAHFAALRPPQMAVALLGTAALLARVTIA